MTYTFTKPYFCGSFTTNKCEVDADFIKQLQKAFNNDIKPTKTSFYDDDTLDYLLKDIMKEKAKEAEEKLNAEIEKKKRKAIDNYADRIKNVYFNDPYTIIVWKDGSKSIVKCQEGDVYDKEKGLALALLKHLSGNTSYFNTIFKKWLPDEE